MKKWLQKNGMLLKEKEETPKSIASTDEPAVIEKKKVNLNLHNDKANEELKKEIVKDLIENGDIMKIIMQESSKQLMDELIKNQKEMKSLIVSCPGCGGIHFRHAGYVETMIPYGDCEGQAKKNIASREVKICVKCKKAYVYMDDHIYDISDRIDLKAWEKSEVELQRATGPGGEC